MIAIRPAGELPLLRVINGDRVKGGADFGTHGHRDMETPPPRSRTSPQARLVLTRVLTRARQAT